MNYKQSIYLHILTISLVLIGSFETVSTNLIGFSLLNLINNNSIKMIFTLLIGISVIYHLFNKYTYLPFLGYNVLPYSLLKQNTTQEITDAITIGIDVPVDNPYTHVIYWASNESDKLTDSILPWDLAYGEFTNSGIELVNNKTKVNVNIKCPSSYKVPSLLGSKIIPKHVHYRFVSKDGMMSRIYTKYVKC